MVEKIIIMIRSGPVSVKTIYPGPRNRVTSVLHRDARLYSQPARGLVRKQVKGISSQSL